MINLKKFFSGQEILEEANSPINGKITVVNPICGDANTDARLNIADAVFLINHVFKSGPAPKIACVGDSNGDQTTNVGDAVYLINYVFKSGPPPISGCCP